MSDSTTGCSLEGRVQLNPSEVENVRSFLNKLEKPTGTCSLTHIGIFSFPFFVWQISISVWINASDIPFKQYQILGFGATNHMTQLPAHFSIYLPCLNIRKTFIEDDTLIIVTRQERFKLTHPLPLTMTFIFQNCLSLISIQKLTKDLSCNVIFYNTSCVFKDENRGMMTRSSR